METEIDDYVESRIFYSVEGFKSIATEQSIELAPLTLLAGANSSGKSSIIQPLLLLKQTLESSFDPGSILLSGPNLNIASAEQILCRKNKNEFDKKFKISFNSSTSKYLSFIFENEEKGLLLSELTQKSERDSITLNSDMLGKEVSTLPKHLQTMLKQLKKSGVETKTKLVRNRIFFDLVINFEDNERFMVVSFSDVFIKLISHLIHLPGLRNAPERTYQRASVEENTFQGTFDKYFASLILNWHEKRDMHKLEMLNENLFFLGLASAVNTKVFGNSEISLFVSRLLKRSNYDFVNIADVGIGTSQVFPILVALIQAEPGQVVYIEQPETHLHPAAQAKLAKILVDAAKRSVRVVVETHSSILLLAIQTLIAEGRIESEKVKLHWFEKDDLGHTRVSVGELDENGTYGDWPVDFGNVSMDLENAYLEAAEANQLKKLRSRKRGK